MAERLRLLLDGHPLPPPSCRRAQPSLRSHLLPHSDVALPPAISRDIAIPTAPSPTLVGPVLFASPCSTISALTLLAASLLPALFTTSPLLTRSPAATGSPPAFDHDVSSPVSSRGDLCCLPPTPLIVSFCTGSSRVPLGDAAECDEEGSDRASSHTQTQVREGLSTHLSSTSTRLVCFCHWRVAPAVGLS